MNRLLLRTRARLRDAAKPMTEAAVGGLTIALLRTTRFFDPDKTANFFGRATRFIGRRLREDRIGRENLTAAFPEKSPQEIETILTGVWDNLGRIGAEFAHLDHIWDYDVDHPDKPSRVEFDPRTKQIFDTLRDDGKPIIGCMRKTLADAGLEPEQIDHINAHGTATPENDKMEYNTTAVVFGEHLPKIPVSSNKSMVGHTISAAGAVEAVFSLLTLEHQRIPPTINYEIPDPAILFDVVGNTARDAKVTAVMSNSFGFGGQNASLILTREPV